MDDCSGKDCVNEVTPAPHKSVGNSPPQMFSHSASYSPWVSLPKRVAILESTPSQLDFIGILAIFLREITQVVITIRKLILRSRDPMPHTEDRVQTLPKRTHYKVTEPFSWQPGGETAPKKPYRRLDTVTDNQLGLVFD